MERAVYLSRTAALSAVIEYGRRVLTPDEVIQKQGAAYPVYRRGELVGWEAWYPLTDGVRFPVMEAQA